MYLQPVHCEKEFVMEIQLDRLLFGIVFLFFAAMMITVLVNHDAYRESRTRILHLLDQKRAQREASVLKRANTILLVASIVLTTIAIKNLWYAVYLR